MLRLVLGFLCAFTSYLSAATEIILSPDGPLRTPLTARDAARAAAKPVRVLVKPGLYRMESALVLEKADSGVTWEADPSGTPVWSGGRKITGWQPVGDGLWKASLPGGKESGWLFEQLWVNGRRAKVAREPDHGFFHITQLGTKRAFPDGEPLNFRTFCVEPDTMKLLAAIPEMERAWTLLTVMHAWAVSQCRIERLKPESYGVLIRGRAAYPFVEYEPDQRWFVENFRAALDTPGEWYLDREAGEVLYKPLPGEDMSKAEVIAPFAEKLLVIDGSSEVTFRGLSLQHGGWMYPKDGLHDMQAAVSVDGAVEIRDAREVHFERCEIAHVGRYGIYFRNGCTDSSARSTHLHDLGAGGIRIGEIEPPSEERITRRIVVDDCIIAQGGRMQPSACGVMLTHATHCAVTHCDISDFFYTGVSAGWNWGYGESIARENRIENNHIHHLGWGYLSDMGGFYGLGAAPGTVVRGNHIHHIASFRYGGWGLYNDEGSTDVLMENNLVHDTTESTFHQHYGFYNTVRNNILAFGGRAQIQRSRNEPRLSFIFSRNIVVWDPSSLLLDGGEHNWKLSDSTTKGDPKDTAIFRRNLYWQTDGKFPEKLASKWTWDEWCKLGRDAGSVIADPKFENLAARDFRLRPGSPAEKIGFQPWDLSLAGVRKDSVRGPGWRALALRDPHENWTEDSRPWPAPPFRIALQTFENDDIGSLPVRNARAETENKGDSIAVTDEAASPLPVEGGGSSRQSLRFQDAPEMSQTFKLVLYVTPKWVDGTIFANFDAMAQKDADWFFELRSELDGEFAAGPILFWRNGKVWAGNAQRIDLAAIPAGEWFRVETRATIGAGKWHLTLIRADGTRAEFRDLPCKPSWMQCHAILWSSLSDKRTAFFLDNLHLSRIEPAPLR